MNRILANCRNALLVAGIGLISGFQSVAPNVKKDNPIQPVPFTAVKLTDEFWARRLEINRTVTIPFVLNKCEETGRIDNFAIAGGLKPGEQCGIYPFDDTDVYKVIEGASYSLSNSPDPALDKRLDEIIAKITAAQEKDGYLYTARTNKATKLQGWMGASRWSNLSRSHELYDSGHLFEAAVAHYQATGKRSLLNVAIKNADLLVETFAARKLELPPGHQVVEMGLVKLYRVTDDKRYLKLAKFFLDERGRPHNNRQLWGEYSQDHKPIVEQDEVTGHAVRAMYMCAGIADVAMLMDDQEYAAAIDRLWQNLVTKKLYITGGIGAQGFWEGFGPNYDLPNMSAYCETCASIALVMCSHRLFLLHGDASYLDVLERTLYNALLAGISMTGDRFFYPNPLASRGQHERSSWFDCACCISNIARFVSSVPGYVYAQGSDTLYVNLFASSAATIELNGANVRIQQQSKYPWDGHVQLSIEPVQPSRFTLALRIPGWAWNQTVPSDLYSYAVSTDQKPSLKVNGKLVALKTEKGFASIQRTWQRGDMVELDLPMPVRRVQAHPLVAEDSGKLALERGPLVYCAEWPDNKNGHVFNLVLPQESKLLTKYQPDLLNGVVTISGKAWGMSYKSDSQSLQQEEQEFVGIPYYAWAHRGAGEMAVWIPFDESRANALNAPSLATQSKTSSSGGFNPEALTVEWNPQDSRDAATEHFFWSPRTDTMWVQYDLPRFEEISEAQVFWYEDTAENGCRVPKTWRILARFQNRWEPVWNPEKKWGIEPNKFNKVIFETVKTDAVRLEVLPQSGFSAGILQWRVY